jgi:long-chain acyl-CoA synthetase
MGLVQAICESLRQHPGKVICRDSENEFTGQQVLDACQGAARLYASTVAGRTVGVVLPGCAWYPVAVFGAIWAGKIPVPLNPLLTPQELNFILQEAAIDTVVVAKLTEPALAGLGVKCVHASDLVRFSAASELAPAPADPNETAVLLYTSGTTGRPKGVPLTHQNLLSNARGVISRLAEGAGDVFLGVLPLFHAFGLMGSAVIPLLLAAEVTYTRFSPQRIAALIAQRRANIFLGVPSMYRLLVRSRDGEVSLRRLRLVISGGDALPGSIRDAYRQRFGHELLEGYGLTETSPVISVNTPEENQPGTVGRVLPQVEVRIQGEDGSLQRPGTEGEIQVRGPSVMSGYYNRPEESRAAFTADGWFRTGDRGSLDAAHFLTVSGRIKELIVRDGEKIMPREVEEILEQHPKVLDAAVLGEPDGKRGEAVVAFVTAADQPPNAEELREFCRGRLAEFKVPRRFVIASDLPRGPTGKILKRALQNWKPA